MSITKKFSIITVNYNSTEKLNNLLGSLNKIDKYIKNVIIIDNNSNDFSKLESNRRDIILIKNSANLGFSKAVNQGINIAKTKIILLINPDCEICDISPITTFKKIVLNQKIGAIGGNILNYRTKQLQKSATSKPNFLIGLFEFTNLKKIFPNNEYSKAFWKENSTLTKPIRVYSVCGAYIFFRKLNNIKFNEDYFLYLEDLDFGKAIESKNLETWFDPSSQITHIGGYSSNSKYNIVLKYWYKSRKTYFLSHLNWIEGRILYIIFCIEEFLLSIYHTLTHTPNE